MPTISPDVALISLLLVSAITATVSHQRYKQGHHTAGVWLSNLSAITLALCAFGIGITAACGA